MKESGTSTLKRSWRDKKLTKKSTTPKHSCKGCRPSAQSSLRPANSRQKHRIIRRHGKEAYLLSHKTHWDRKMVSKERGRRHGDPAPGQVNGLTTYASPRRLRSRSRVHSVWTHKAALGELYGVHGRPRLVHLNSITPHSGHVLDSRNILGSQVMPCISTRSTNCRANDTSVSCVGSRIAVLQVFLTTSSETGAVRHARKVSSVFAINLQNI